MNLALLCLLAYLIGSISFAVIVSRCFSLADPRSVGSKNPGATNVLRSGNKRAALLTLLGDGCKGALAIYIGRILLSDQWQPVGLAYVGVAVVIGHLWPIFFKFRGGKGVATAFGVLLALHPLVAIAALFTWIAVFLLRRTSSLAAIATALAVPLYAFFLSGLDPTTVSIATICSLLLYRHKRNIADLWMGREPPIHPPKVAKRD